jgi:hypothetical protein
MEGIEQVQRTTKNKLKINTELTD